MTFASIYADKPEAIQAVARELRELILAIDKRIAENIHGGAKVKIALYSIGDAHRVLYGIQPADRHCKLYLHHTDRAKISSLKLQGKGKQAKHVQIAALDGSLKEAVKKALLEILLASGY